MTPDENKLLNNFAQIYREVPHFRKMLLVKAVFDTMSNGLRRKRIWDPRWVKFCSMMQLLSPAAYSFIRSNAANGCMPGRHSLNKSSKESLLDITGEPEEPDENTPSSTCPSNGVQNGLELLDLSLENLKRQVSKIPQTWIWCCAMDETFCVQALTPYKGVFIGGIKNHVIVPKEMPLEEKQSVPLAKQFKVWVAFPLNCKWSYHILGIRLGGATEEEETFLNTQVIRACHNHSGFVCLAADGATKERSQLRNLVIQSGRDVGLNSPGRNLRPFSAVVDMDHLHKSLLSAIQYGGTAPPHGEVGLADPFPLFKTSLSLRVLRRTDWASSSSPHLFCDPKHLRELLDGGMTKDQLLPLAAYMVGMRSLHFSVFCRDPRLQQQARAEIMYFGMLLLGSFTKHASIDDAISVTGWGHIYLWLEHPRRKEIHAHHRVGTLCLEEIFGL